MRRAFVRTTPMHSFGLRQSRCFGSARATIASALQRIVNGKSLKSFGCDARRIRFSADCDGRVRLSSLSIIDLESQR